MSTTLPVKEIFYSIQGEGPFVGRPAVFVRFGTCNLACPKCDTDFRTGRKNMTVREILDAVMARTPPNRLFVLTGGEPMQLPISELTECLLTMGSVQIETNGTEANLGLPYGHPRLSIVCSPKTREVRNGLVPYVRAWKYVLEADDVASDGLPASCFSGELGPPARPPVVVERSDIFVQPCDRHDPELNRRNLQVALKSCLDYGYTLSIQLHKHLGLP